MRSRGVSSSSSSPRAPALALLLLLILCLFFFFHCPAAAARPLTTSAIVQGKNDGVKAAADGQLLRADLTGNGDEVTELMGAEEEDEACEEKGNEDCVQRRLLRDAHLDYIYTQHKNKP